MLSAQLQSESGISCPSPTIPKLEQPKASALAALPSPNSRRSYEHAITKFIEWFCCKPRLGNSIAPLSFDIARSWKVWLFQQPQ